MAGGVTFISAVLLVSPRPADLVYFYRALGVPLREERHGDTEPHFGCELGDVHFAIHPESSFEGSGLGRGAIRLALAVDDITAMVNSLEPFGVRPEYPPRDVGFAIMTEVVDPDGNRVELTQLAPSWIAHLREKRSRADPPGSS